MPAGVYKDSFATRASGAAAAYIAYIAASVDFSHPVNCPQVTANHASTSTCVSLIGTARSAWANTGDYVVIKGFDVRGPDIGLGRQGIYTGGISTPIIGNSVHDIATSSCGALGAAGFGPDGAIGFVDGNYIYNVGLPHCWFTLGIYPNGQTTGTTVIENNIVLHIASYTIQSWGNSGGDVIVNNTLFNSPAVSCLVPTHPAKLTATISSRTTSVTRHRVELRNRVSHRPAQGQTNCTRTTSSLTARPRIACRTGW